MDKTDYNKNETDLKALILMSAKKLFIEKGIDNTTINDLANDVKCNIEKVNELYKDINSISHDLRTLGFIKLYEYLVPSISINDPMLRLKEIGKSYIKFASENYELYHSMFNLNEIMNFWFDLKKEEWKEKEKVFEIVRQTIEKCIQEGFFKNHSANSFSVMIWSVLHGMCSLETKQKIKGINLSDSESISFEAFNDYFEMITK